MDMQHAGLAHPKPTRRKTVKGRKDRAEAAVLKAAREACVARDGYCRLLIPKCGDQWVSFRVIGVCRGISTLAHLAGARRSGTRGQAASQRHDPARMAMLCERHHDLEERRGLRLEPLTDRGLNGPVHVHIAAPKAQP